MHFYAIDAQVPKESNHFTEFRVNDISETVPRGGETEVQRRNRLERNEEARLLAEEAGEDMNIPLMDEPVVHDKVRGNYYMHLGVEDVCTLRSPGKLIICVTAFIPTTAVRNTPYFSSL